MKIVHFVHYVKRTKEVFVNMVTDRIDTCIMCSILETLRSRDGLWASEVLKIIYGTD